MTIPSTGGVGGTTPATQSQSVGQTGLGQLDSNAFLKLLVAQLRYQNPMSPSDPSAMLGQTAQFTQVETLQALAKTQAQLATLSQTGMAAGLVGREVAAVTPEGTTLTGTVEAVRFQTTGPVLLVGGREVGLAQVSEVRPSTQQGA